MSPCTRTWLQRREGVTRDSQIHPVHPVVKAWSMKCARIIGTAITNTVDGMIEPLRHCETNKSGDINEALAAQIFTFARAGERWHPRRPSIDIEPHSPRNLLRSVPRDTGKKRNNYVGDKRFAVVFNVANDRAANVVLWLKAPPIIVRLLRYYAGIINYPRYAVTLLFTNASGTERDTPPPSRADSNRPARQFRNRRGWRRQCRKREKEKERKVVLRRGLAVDTLWWDYREPHFPVFPGSTNNFVCLPQLQDLTYLKREVFLAREEKKRRLELY